jgi:hypothetical protein
MLMIAAILKQMYHMIKLHQIYIFHFEDPYLRMTKSSFINNEISMIISIVSQPSDYRVK